MRTKILIICSLILVTSAVHGQKLLVNGFNSDFTMTEISSEAQTIEFDIATTASTYTITHLPSWVTLQRQEGGTFSLLFGANNADARRGSFMVNAGEQSLIVSFSQSAHVQPHLSVNGLKKVNTPLNPSGGTFAYSVDAEPSEYSISTLPSWCQIQSKGPNSFTLSYDANNTGAKRFGLFFLQSGVNYVFVNLEQDVSYKPVETPLLRGEWRSKVLARKNVSNRTVYKDGSVYVGMLNANGERHGFGAYFYADGTMYIGFWLNGNRHGYGMFFVSDMSKYHVINCPGTTIVVSEMNNGVRQGGGECYDKYGNALFRGYFYNDKPIGNIPSTPPDSLNGDKFEYVEYTSGDFYLGETENGIRQGVGAYFWKDGSWWIGIWENDKRNGWGMYVNTKGRWNYAQWANGTELPNAQNNSNSNADYQLGYELGRMLFDMFKK